MSLLLLVFASITLVIFLAYLLRTFRPKRSCPVCDNPHPERITRPVSTPTAKPYYCQACGRQFVRASELNAD